MSCISVLHFNFMSILTVAVFDEKPQNALTKVAIIIICIFHGEDVLRPCRSIVQPVGIITLRGVQLLLGLIDLFASRTYSQYVLRCFN